jgi:nucleoside 2-deoxyribosyltransferase
MDDLLESPSRSTGANARIQKISRTWRNSILKIYIAGKWEERKKVAHLMELFRIIGHKITCDWTTHEYPTENIKDKLRDYAVTDIRGVADCDVFIFYAISQLGYRGAFCEMGAALALGKPVFIIGDAIDSCIFTDHPLVQKIVLEELAL